MPLPPARLASISLGSVNFAINGDFDLANAHVLDYEVVPTVEISDLERDDEGVRAGMSLTAAIDWALSDAQQDNAEDRANATSETEPLSVPFHMNMTVLATFEWSKDAMPDDDLARGWLEYNGMYLMWPYLRSYVGMVTGMSFLPALTIYTMNVPKPPVIAKDDSDETAASDAGAAISADEPLSTE